jgi:hypothetical protein
MNDQRPSATGCGLSANLTDGGVQARAPRALARMLSFAGRNAHTLHEGEFMELML